MITAKYRVCYGDTDQMAVVYYANYLRIFEFGRVIYMRKVGLPYREVEAQGIIMPVTDARVRYLKSAHFEDLLLVDVALVRMRRASAEFGYRIRRDNDVIAMGRTRHASLDRGGKLTRLPQTMHSLLQLDPEDVFEKPLPSF